MFVLLNKIKTGKCLLNYGLFPFIHGYTRLLQHKNSPYCGVTRGFSQGVKT